MKFRLYREFFRALANPTRFAIVQRLLARPHYVGELVDTLEVEQSRVSHNLACLLNCGFVEWEWQGKNKVYRLHPDLASILNAIDKHLARYASALESCQVLETEAPAAPRTGRAHMLRRRRSQKPFGARHER